MSIADKLSMIAENEQKIYEAGKIEGRNSVIDESKIIKKNVAGESCVFLEDVSEVIHNITVKLTGGTNVKVLGNNLLPYPYSQSTITSNGITFTDNGDGTITANGMATADANYRIFLWQELSLPAHTYIACGTPKGGSLATFYTSFAFRDDSGSTVYDGYDIGQGFVLNKNSRLLSVYAEITIKAGQEVDNLVFKPQISNGTTVLDYDTYREPIEYSTDSDSEIVNIQSISPHMIFLADEGVYIECEYQKSYGIQVENKRIFGAIQNYGQRVEYGSAFTNGGWSKENFKPPYDMRPTQGASMFMQLNNNPADAPQIDFVEIAEEQEMVFDFSNCKNFNMCFATGGISRLGVIDFKSATTLPYVFYGVYNSTQGLRKIDKLICYESNVFQSTTFQSCGFLTDLTVEGVIASSIDLSACPLTLESAKSVILHLKDLYASGEMFSQTILFSDHTWALLDADEGWTDDGGYVWSWRHYVTEEVCWNISQ